ncbi:MAG: hypothetical protein CMB82_10640 [Flammeovirgaceae bacterium]|nr:hypothetical protein [Flammeovirgaceae bacterium]
MGKGNLAKAIKFISSEVDSLSPNVISILQDDQKEISQTIIKTIRSSHCPHLNELLNERLKFSEV